MNARDPADRLIVGVAAAIVIAAIGLFVWFPILLAGWRAVCPS